MKKGYKYRLYPNKLQREVFQRHFDGVRYIYNKCLDFCQKGKKENGKYYTKKQAQDYLLKLKKQEDWLYKVNSQSLQIAIRDLYNAFANIKKIKAGYPNYKSKKTYHPSFSMSQNCKINQENGYITIPKPEKQTDNIGNIKAKIHRKFEGTIRTCTISLSRSGKYYVSATIDDGKPEEESNVSLDKENTVGLDMGITNFITTSNGIKIDNPQYFITGGKKLKKVQRQFSRLKKISKRRKCFRKKIAIVHEKISNKRVQYQYEEAKKLWNDNQVEAIALEDLGIKNMMQNSRLSKHIADSSWYQFKTIIKNKMSWAGKKVIQSGRFDATSKICHHCNYKNNNLKLHNRLWTCSECNLLNDRDINAAKNIRDFALGALEKELLRKGKPFV